mmetsp:Transcript_49858/g.92720  ORF Transcript_49858/g.92720 Transcript_49858/m.92720 type:complete len:213 (+) Transcript_49858:541-1179(+)
MRAAVPRHGSLDVAPGAATAADAAGGSHFEGGGGGDRTAAAAPVSAPANAAVAHATHNCPLRTKVVAVGDARRKRAACCPLREEVAGGARRPIASTAAAAAAAGGSGGWVEVGCGRLAATDIRLLAAAAGGASPCPCFHLLQNPCRDDDAQPQRPAQRRRCPGPRTESTEKSEIRRPPLSSAPCRFRRLEKKNQAGGTAEGLTWAQTSNRSA